MIYKKSSPESIRSLFSTIATYYDYVNFILSFGLHKIWNKKLIKLVEKQLPKDCNIKLLDLCAGTGEVAFSFLKKNKNSTALLLDFCPEMLKVAEKRGASLKKRFFLLEGDAQSLPINSESTDVVTVAYGIRNISDPIKCFEEVFRVLKHSGYFAVLELTRPPNPVLSFLHKVYLRFFIPILTSIITNNHKAYNYLSSSIQEFVSTDNVVQKLYKSGFSEIKITALNGSLATIILAKKQ